MVYLGQEAVRDREYDPSVSTSFEQEPRYSQIERALRDRLAKLSPGDSLPSDAMLCEEFGVSRMTARTAVQRLVEEGLVERVPGFGTYVGRRPEIEHAGSPAAAVAMIFTRLAEEQELTVSQLARSLKRPRNEVVGLLETLSRHDLVEPGARAGAYRLGLGILRLGSAVERRFNVRQAALPVMESLHRLSEETIYLCIRRGLDAVCIERLDGLRVQSMALRLGGSLPLHLGAAPRVLLAYEPEELWEEYVSRSDLAPMTPLTLTTRDELFASLERIRADGYAVSEGDVVQGIASVGAPIFSRGGRPCAALSMGGAEPTILGEHRTESIRSVVAGATEISRTLGYERPDV